MLGTGSIQSTDNAAPEPVAESATGETAGFFAFLADELDIYLTIPLLDGRKIKESELIRELENNAQGILGYVARWVGQGVGCSKVPDINNVGLMGDAPQAAFTELEAPDVRSVIDRNLVATG